MCCLIFSSDSTAYENILTGLFQKKGTLDQNYNFELKRGTMLPIYGTQIHFNQVEICETLTNIFPCALKVLVEAFTYIYLFDWCLTPWLKSFARRRQANVIVGGQRTVHRENTRLWQVPERPSHLPGDELDLNWHRPHWWEVSGSLCWGTLHTEPRRSRLHI